MHQNKVLLILKTFTRKEMTRFFEFCYSPYHNKHKGVRALVSYLKKRFPDFSDKYFDTKKMVRIFPGASKSEIALIFTYTKRVLDEFLSIESLIDDNALKSEAILQQLRQRKIYSLYEKEWNKRQHQLTNVGANIADLSAHYRLAAEADKYYQSVSKRKDDPNLQRKQQFLDYFFIAEKLKDAVEMILREQILQVAYSKRMLLFILKEVEENWEAYRRIPIIPVYFQLYHLVETKRKEHYFKLLSFLEQHQKQLDKSELIYIYNILKNYCIQRINANDQKFLNEIFKLYQSELKMDLLLENGILLEWHYKNIVTTGLRLGEVDWVAEFIEEYKSNLDSEAYENAYRFNTAALCHAKGEYSRVLELLQQVEYSDLRYNLGAKALLLRTYYELSETDALVSLSVAFRQFLKRNKLLSNSRKQAYFNLFSLTEKMAAFRDEAPFLDKKTRTQKYKKLRKSIEGAAAFNQAWLEEKSRDLDYLL